MKQKRLLAGLIAMAMTVGMMPALVFAEETVEEPAETEVALTTESKEKETVKPSAKETEKPDETKETEPSESETEKERQKSA